jgi:hypothetical protein
MILREQADNLTTLSRPTRVSYRALKTSGKTEPVFLEMMQHPNLVQRTIQLIGNADVNNVEAIFEGYEQDETMVHMV